MRHAAKDRTINLVVTPSTVESYPSIPWLINCDSIHLVNTVTLGVVIPRTKYKALRKGAQVLTLVGIQFFLCPPSNPLLDIACPVTDRVVPALDMCTTAPPATTFHSLPLELSAPPNTELQQNVPELTNKQLQS